MIKNKIESSFKVIIFILVFIPTSFISNYANANIFSIIVKNLDNIISTSNTIRIGERGYRIFDKLKDKCSENPYPNCSNQKKINKFPFDKKHKPSLLNNKLVEDR